MSDMHYMGLKERQVVVFVDILGFRDITLKNEHTTMESKGGIIVNIPSISNIINGTDFSKEYQSRKQFKYLWVSDSIAMSSNIENFNVILDELCKIINMFYCCSFALRGAITVGKIYHEDNIWGPAFVRAVEDEKHAMFPRVIIKKEYYDQLNVGSSYKEFFKEADYNYLFFNYFDYFISTASKDKQDISAALNVYSRFISDSIKTARDDKTIGKYIWLAKTLKDSIVKHSDFIDVNCEYANHSDLLNLLRDGVI